MAFYRDMENKGRPKKRNYANEGSWDDEGAHYSGAGRRDGERPYHSSGRPAASAVRYNGAGEHNPNHRPARVTDHRFGPSADRRQAPGDRGFRVNDHQGGFGGPRRPDGDRRPADPARRAPRPAPVTETAPRGHRDFEYISPKQPERLPRPVARPVPVAVPVEVETPENLLAGRNPIREALKNGRDIEKLLVQRGELSGSAREIVQMAREKHIIVQEVDKQRLDEIAPHHQGMLAFASAYQYSTVDAMLAEAAEKGEDPFLILLDGVTDPHNLGAVIRSAECVGAHGVIVPERRSVGLTPAAVKASAGAIEHMKVARVTNLNRTIDDLKKLGVWAYAVTMDGQDYTETDFSGGVALVIGAEGEGISRLTLENCDCRVSLPMKGHIDSLNASVAAGVMMYRVLECRKG